MAEEKTELSIKPTKKKRIPVYKQRSYDYSNLNLDLKKFHYHWANGTPSNLERYMIAEYVQYKDKEGKPITRRGKNEELYQHLLFIPIELYNKDNEGKLKEPREIEAAMKAGTSKGNPFLSPQFTYGGVQTVEQVGRSLIDSNGVISKITEDK